MINLYLKIENGQPVGHPFTKENLLDIHGEIPSDFVPFKRVQLHEYEEHGLFASDYQKHVSSYGLGEDGITWQDIWRIEDMTADEIAVRRQQLKEDEEEFNRQLFLQQVLIKKSQNT